MRKRPLGARAVPDRSSSEVDGGAPPPTVPGTTRAAGHPRWWPAWLGRDLSLLFTARGLRSLTQGYLAVIVPLYLATLGFNAVQLGIVFAAAAIASALLAAAIGVLADRFGRKVFLILIALLMAAGGLVFAMSSSFLVLVLAGALGTIGRGGGAGSGGAWGPFYPAEQALIAEHSPNAARTSIFGALSFVGVIGGAIGSLLAVFPAVLQSHHLASTLTGYRLLFLSTILFGALMVVVIVPVHEAVTRKPAAGATRATTSARGPRPEYPSRGWFGLSRTSRRLLWRFMITNATNGVAIGIIGSFIVYWFYKRYGVGSGEIGTFFVIVNLAAAIPYLLAGKLARRLGAVNTVIVTRAVSVGVLFLVAVMPTYLLASALYLVRMIAITLSNPVRQSYLMGVVPPEERSTMAGLSNLPSQVFAAVSPTFAGYLIQSVALDLPLEVAAAFQGINTLLYWAFFRDVRPPEEQDARQGTRQAPLPAEQHLDATEECAPTSQRETVG